MLLDSRNTTAALAAGIFYVLLIPLANASGLVGLESASLARGSSVPCRIAVHQVAPKGWVVAVPERATLCSSVSWHQGSSPLSVLERIAMQSDLAIIVNVPTHVLRFSANGHSSLTASIPASTAGVNTAGPTAFVGTTIRAPLTAIAFRYGLKLKCSKACNRLLPGPVTILLEGDISQDVKLLQDALGRIEPLKVIEDPVAHTLLVSKANQASFRVEEVTRPLLPWWRRIFS